MPSIGESHVLIIATDGFEQDELFEPRRLLLEAGARVTLAAPGRSPIQATVRDDPGRTIRPDRLIAEVDADDYDALLVPGGLRNPDALRTDHSAVALVRAFAAQDKPLAAICHGPWLLIEADVVRGHMVTGWRSIRTDLANAGGQVVDQPAVIDGNLITARGPDDVPQLTAALIARIESR